MGKKNNEQNQELIQVNDDLKNKTLKAEEFSETLTATFENERSLLDSSLQKQKKEIEQLTEDKKLLENKHQILHTEHDDLKLTTVNHEENIKEKESKIKDLMNEINSITITNEEFKKKINKQSQELIKVNEDLENKILEAEKLSKELTSTHS